MAEHLLLEVGDVIRFQQKGNELWMAEHGLGVGDHLYRRVIGYQDDWYITQGFWPGDSDIAGYVAAWDIRHLQQTFIDRFAKKLMSGPGEEQAG